MKSASNSPRHRSSAWASNADAAATSSSARADDASAMRESKLAGVDVAVFDSQAVAGAFGAYRVGAESFAKAGDVGLEGLACAGRGRFVPYGVNQGVGGDGPVRVQEQPSQHRPLAMAAEDDGAAVVGDLEWI